MIQNEDVMTFDICSKIRRQGAGMEGSMGMIDSEMMAVGVA